MLGKTFIGSSSLPSGVGFKRLRRRGGSATLGSSVRFEGNCFEERRRLKGDRRAKAASASVSAERGASNPKFIEETATAGAMAFVCSYMGLFFSVKDWASVPGAPDLPL